MGRERLAGMLLGGWHSSAGGRPQVPPKNHLEGALGDEAGENRHGGQRSLPGSLCSPGCSLQHPQKIFLKTLMAVVNLSHHL